MLAVLTAGVGGFLCSLFWGFVGATFVILVLVMVPPVVIGTIRNRSLRG